MTAQPTLWQRVKTQVRERLQIIDAQSQRVVSVFMIWLLGDVAFAVLPVVVMSVLMTMVGHEFNEFLLLKEWSFAAIVLYGVAIRKLIKLKVEIQLEPRSPKLDTGVQFHVLLVIMAVLVLALVVLAELESVGPLNTDSLEVAQMVLFGISLFAVWQAVWYEENWHEMIKSRSRASQTVWFFRYAKVQVDEAFIRANRLNDALEHLASRKSDSTDEEPMLRRRREKLIAETLTAIERLKVTLAESEERLRHATSTNAA